MEDSNVLIKEKIRKLGEIKEQGVNPYPYSYNKTHTTTQILDTYKLKPEEKSPDVVNVAGRIVAMRRMGKATFMHVQDESGKIQVYFRLDDVGKEEYKFLKKLDLGDIIGVKGPLFATRMGEITIDVREYELLTKSILPLPEKFHGLKDKEIRYRQRYTDLIVNPDVKEVFKKRSKIIRSIRNFLDEKGIMEVEVPVLQTIHGGAAARPFETHINAWNMKMYLSISPELYLKRLLVGGFENVFTICKNFRNEGVDHSHNPEFTMIEIYQAYKDYNDMMELIEQCYEYVALEVNGTTKVKHMYKGQEVEIDFKAPWPRMTMAQAIEKHLNINVLTMSKEALLDFANENGLDASGSMSWGDLVLEIFELVEDKIIQPTHVYDMPKEGTPLCKRHRIDDRLNEQCEPIGLGMELGNMYSELNDPFIQEEEFKKQVEKGEAGDDEAQPMDKDFLNAIKTGMPPAGGIGWGIDRMAILMTGVESIRDIILFPTMKPEEEKKSKSQIDTPRNKVSEAQETSFLSEEKKAKRKAEETAKAEDK